MSAVIEKISISEYLEKERKSPNRTEYIQGELRELTGASFIHNKIVINLIRNISSKINTKKWEILSSDMKVWIPSKETFYYPDVLVLPNPPHFHEDSKDILINPICIFEVLSESTRNFDKGEKFDAYRSIEGFKEYYLVEQSKKLITQCIINSRGNWELIEHKDENPKFSLPTLNIELSISEIYEGVEMD
ncbi:MAG: Uma2 family endonuclease [Leptospiraceae bacterium]|nr:Uma2 family endonuclease [Leptospiraceae bacterium]